MNVPRIVYVNQTERVKGGQSLRQRYQPAAQSHRMAATAAGVFVALLSQTTRKNTSRNLFYFGPSLVTRALHDLIPIVMQEQPHPPGVSEV